ncbi:MAG TPA: energy transducer TonB, partial [Verrucomicrobiae bacterium]|nr:energy transducer TonB [Verrucomicrobiae bacterium]
ELAKERADARRRAAEVSRAMASLKGDFSPSTSVKIDVGPGGGGPAYANFYSAVTTVYYNAWHQPNGVPNLTVKVSVTIARDGTVISARILKSSGNSTVDNSVQETIDRVKFVVPLPPDSKEDSREVTVNFSTQSTATG